MPLAVRAIRLTKYAPQSLLLQLKMSDRGCRAHVAGEAEATSIITPAKRRSPHLSRSFSGANIVTLHRVVVSTCLYASLPDQNCVTPVTGLYKWTILPLKWYLSRRHTNSDLRKLRAVELGNLRIIAREASEGSRILLT